MPHKPQNIPALLRGIRDDFVDYVLPGLSAGDSIEHVVFARMVLDRMATEIELKDSLGETFAARYRALIADIKQALGLQPDRALAQERDLGNLRKQLSATVRLLTQLAVNAPASAEWLTKIVALEAELRQALGKAQQAGDYQPHDHANAPARMTSATLTGYLQRRYPSLPAEPVVELRLLPGGHSKSTFFVTLKTNDALPEVIVIRQDIPSGVVDTVDGATRVAREYPVLLKLAAMNLPVAKPLLLEADISECGQPFMITTRLPGTPPGNLYGFTNPQDPLTQSVVRDMAKVLGRLHSLDITHMALPGDMTQKPEDRLRREVEYRWHKWQRDAVEPSPIVECALSRLLMECRPDVGLGGPTLVHGDMLSHNLLAADGRITAVLDWESVHAGDPAQDLAYCRHAVKQVLPWAEFIDIYVASGGKPIGERRLLIHELAAVVRNCTFAASAARHYLDKGTRDFTIGAAGYFIVPSMEPQILALLEAMESSNQD